MHINVGKAFLLSHTGGCCGKFYIVDILPTTISLESGDARI